MTRLRLIIDPVHQQEAVRRQRINIAKRTAEYNERARRACSLRLSPAQRQAIESSRAEMSALAGSYWRNRRDSR